MTLFDFAWNNIVRDKRNLLAGFTSKEGHVVSAILFSNSNIDYFSTIL